MKSLKNVCFAFPLGCSLVAHSFFPDHWMHIPNRRSPSVPASTMTSSPGTPQHSDEYRPAGGTAPKSGTKTPRRVQWASKDDVRVEGNPGTSPRESIHELDEMGLDVRSCLPIALFRRNLRMICSPVHSRPSGMPWRSTIRRSIFRVS